MGSEAGCVTTKQGEVAQEMNVLTKCIERCDKKLNMLVERLQPILANPVTEESKPSDKDEGVCALAGAIRELRRKLQSVEDRIDYTTSKVEL